MTTVGMIPDPDVVNDWEKYGNPVIKFIANEIRNNSWQIEPINREMVWKKPWLLKSKKIDLLHIHWPFTIYYIGNERRIWKFIPKNLRFFLLKVRLYLWQSYIKRLKIPVVWEIHDLTSHHLYGDSASKGIDYFLYKTIFDLANGIIIHEDSCLPLILDHFKTEYKVYTTACLGDFSRVYGNRISREEALSNLGFPHTNYNKIFGCIGTARKNRNPKEVVDAFLKTSKEDDLLLIGGKEVLKYIENPENPKVKIYDGFLPGSLLRDIVCASDYIVNNGKEYLTSAVIRTAISYHKPVIAYPFGSNIDMALGALIPISSHDEGITSAFQTVYSHTPADYQNLCLNAKKRDDERTWEQTGQKIVSLYEKIVKTSHGSK